MTYVPRHEWPNLPRYNLTVRVPKGYKKHPTDVSIFIPDLETIKWIEQALDLIDDGTSLRDTADWLTEKLGDPISHQGIQNIWKKYRGKDKDNPRAKAYRKRRRKMMPKTKEGKQERLLKYKVMGAKRSLQSREEKLAAIQNKNEIFTDLPPIITPDKDDPYEGREVVFRPNDGPQTAFLEATEQEVLYGGAAGGGKAQPYSALVYTPTGPVTIGALKVGDKVLSPNGGTATVLQIHPQGIVNINRLTTQDGSYTYATDDHLWKVKKLGDPQTSWKILPTKELTSNFVLPLPTAVEFNEVELPIDPYLLGVLLGDGSITTNSIGLTSADEELISLLVSRGHDVRIRKGKYQYGIAGIVQKLRDLNLLGCGSHNKFIPSIYLLGSIQQRLDLLRGLMDTDGYVSIDGKVNYTSMSNVLRQDVAYLIRSLGGTATEFKGHSLYIRHPNSANLFNLSRKKNRTHLKTINNRIVSVTWSHQEAAVCITLDSDDHLYLTDNFIVTHNSYALLADPMRYFDNPNFNGVLFRKTNDELRELIMKSHGLYDKAFPGAKWQEQKSRWVFPSGAQMWLTYLDRDTDVERYQGQAFTWIGFDELGHWDTPYAWNYMRSRLRSTDLTIPLSMRASANPGGLGGHWIKKMFLNPAPPNTPFPATDIEKNEILVFPKGHAREGQPLFYRKFIPAKLSDNPYLTQDDSYEASLLSLPEHLKQQLLYGNWDIMEGAAFPEFEQQYHVIEPFEIPDNWKRFRSADYGYATFSAVYWFAIDPTYETLIVYRELYVTKHTGIDLANKILELEKNEKIQYGMLDSSVWQQRGQKGPSIAEEMIAVGCRWRPADRSQGSRTNGKNRLHELLKLRDMGVDSEGNTRWIPGIQFFNTCRQIIADLPRLPTHPDGKDDIDDKHASDHSYDAIRYGIMSRPRAFSPFDFGQQQFGKTYRPADKVFGY